MEFYYSVQGQNFYAKICEEYSSRQPNLCEKY